jgi:hypothetical protein
MCNQPRFISYHLIIFISLLNENPFEPNRKGSGKRVKLSFNCFFSLVLVLAFLTLYHGLSICIVKEIFSNDS